MGLKRFLRNTRDVIRDPMTPIRRRYKQSQVQLLERLSSLFRSRSFYLQGRMDIDSQSPWYSRDFIRSYGGFFVPNDETKRSVADFEPWDTVRRDMLILLLRSLNERGVPGDLVELGVYRGMTAKLLHHYMPDRTLHLFDTFRGFDPINIASERKQTGLVLKASHFADTSVDGVLRYIEPKSDRICVYPGFFPATVPGGFSERQFAFVHLDADLYEPTLIALQYFYPKLATGGYIVVHDYNSWPGARKAVDEYLAKERAVPVPMPDKSGSVLIVRGG